MENAEPSHSPLYPPLPVANWPSRKRRRLRSWKSKCPCLPPVLGRRVPGLTPGRPFPASPLAVVNSPVEVTVNGRPAEVLAAVGYPGAVDGYQVNFRLPSETARGTATIQIKRRLDGWPGKNYRLEPHLAPVAPPSRRPMEPARRCSLCIEALMADAPPHPRNAPFHARRKPLRRLAPLPCILRADPALWSGNCSWTPQSALTAIEFQR